MCLLDHCRISKRNCDRNVSQLRSKTSSISELERRTKRRYGAYLLFENCGVNPVRL